MHERMSLTDPLWEARHSGSSRRQYPPTLETALPSGVTTFLQQVEPYERISKDCQTSWNSVQRGDGDDAIARAFYEEGGFVAWFAYFRIKCLAEKASRHLGKADCVRLMHILQGADVFVQKNLAVEVVAAFSDEQKQKIEDFQERLSLSGAGQPTTNCKHLETSETSGPCATPIFTTDRTMIERPTTPKPDDFLTSYKQLIVNPPLHTAKKLLHKDLSNAIRTTQNPNPNGVLLAAISMAFPPTGGTNDCQMVLEILDDKVQHFAKRWFRQRLESKDGLRRLVACNGSTIVPYPRMTLQGFRRCRRGDFGRDVSHAITTSPRYQDDEKHSRPYTDSVSMVVAADAKAGAQVYLSLGLVEGIRIKDKLFD